MTDQVIQFGIFDPIIPLIREINKYGYMVIEIPRDLDLDFEKIQSYFESDATLNMTYDQYYRLHTTTMIGTLKDKQLALLLWKKYLAHNWMIEVHFTDAFSPSVESVDLMLKESLERTQKKLKGFFGIDYCDGTSAEQKL